MFVSRIWRKSEFSTTRSCPLDYRTAISGSSLRCPSVARWRARGLSLAASAGLPQSAIQYRGDAIGCLVFGMSRVGRDST